MAESILIVDDDPLARMALAVEVDVHFQVVQAGGTEEALSLLATTDGICAVVSAWEMKGGLDGPDFWRQVQQRLPSCLRVISSRVPSGVEASHLLEGGVAHRCIAKPWKPGEALAAIREGLSARPVLAPQAPPPPPSAAPAAYTCPRCYFQHPKDDPCSVFASIEDGNDSTLVPGTTPQEAPAEGAHEDVDPLLGTIAGTFRLARPLGRGGMGTVYLGEHPMIGSKVAIKFLHESLASDAELVARFYEEARAVNLIGHENIVNIFDLNRLPPNRYYIVMEYLDGKRLSSLVKGGAVEPTIALPILIQLCDALLAAHNQGVVHRDLKPDNVFLISRKGNPNFVKLLDFGIAKLRDATSRPSKTAAGMILGTPEYMAPEQCDSRPVDARTDIYSLGVINYQLATGALPFTAPSVPGYLLAHLQQEPVAPRLVNDSVHPEWERAILKSLAKKPEDRFQSMSELVEALESALEAVPRASKAVPVKAQEPAAHTPQPVHSRHVAGFEVEVRFGGQSPGQKMQATDISRGGMYVSTVGQLPALFSRIVVLIGSPPAHNRVQLVGEVVRHVSPKEAEAWHMAPGFGVQFLELTAPLRAEIAHIVEGLPHIATPRPAAAPADDPAAALVLLYFQKRLAGGHYEILGLSLDASFGDVRSRARSLREEVEALRPGKLSPSQEKQADAALARIDAAVATLGTPYERLEYDAQRSNYRGVTQCMMAGVVNSHIDDLHRQFVESKPEVVGEVHKHVTRALVAKDLGDKQAAVNAYEAALAIDPLNLELHQGYWALKR